MSPTRGMSGVGNHVICPVSEPLRRSGGGDEADGAGTGSTAERAIIVECDKTGIARAKGARHARRPSARRSRSLRRRSSPTCPGAWASVRQLGRTASATPSFSGRRFDFGEPTSGLIPQDFDAAQRRRGPANRVIVRGLWKAEKM